MYTSESSEMYLENILVLSQNKETVRAIDITHYSGYSKPSVSRAMGILKQKGHILVDDLGHITLTESGRAIAENILERHRILTALLVKLGVEPEVAAADACKMEHDISDTTFQALKRFADGEN